MKNYKINRGLSNNYIRESEDIIMVNNRNVFAKNAVLNVIKQCCAILFPLITFPYVTRVLGASNYGKVNYAISVIVYINLIAQLGIRNYAIREGANIRNNPEKLSGVINEVFSINVLSTLLAYLILGLLIVFGSKIQDYKLLVCIISVSVFFETLGMDWINSIFEDYTYITIRYIVCHTIVLLAVYFFVNTQGDYIVYSFLTVLSGIMANTLNLFYLRKKHKIQVRLVCNKRILKHIRPILFIFGMSVAVKIYVQSDIIILGFYCTDAQIGFYTVASNMYVLVKQLINAILVVAIPRISNMLSTADECMVRKQMGAIHDFLLSIIFPATAGLFILRKDLVMLFSGEEFVEAGEPLGILAFSLLFATIATFYSNVVMIPRKMEKNIFLNTWVSAICNIILNFMLIPVLGITAAAITTLVSEMIVCLLHFFKSYTYISFSLKPFLCGGISAGTVVVICSIVSHYIDYLLLRLFISVFLGILSYLFLWILFYYKKRKTE